MINFVIYILFYIILKYGILKNTSLKFFIKSSKCAIFVYFKADIKQKTYHIHRSVKAVSRVLTQCDLKGSFLYHIIHWTVAASKPGCAGKTIHAIKADTQGTGQMQPPTLENFALWELRATNVESKNMRDTWMAPDLCMTLIPDLFTGSNAMPFSREQQEKLTTAEGGSTARSFSRGTRTERKSIVKGALKARDGRSALGQSCSLTVRPSLWLDTVGMGVWID